MPLTATNRHRWTEACWQNQDTHKESEHAFTLKRELKWLADMVLPEHTNSYTQRNYRDSDRCVWDVFISCEIPKRVLFLFVTSHSLYQTTKDYSKMFKTLRCGWKFGNWTVGWHFLCQVKNEHWQMWEVHENVEAHLVAFSCSCKLTVQAVRSSECWMQGALTVLCRHLNQINKYISHK